MGAIKSKYWILTVKKIMLSMAQNQPLCNDSSLAFCPAEMTTSNGRGAKDDQCSCFDTAISAHMPTKQESKRRKRISREQPK